MPETRISTTSTTAHRLARLLPWLFLACLAICLGTGALLLLHYRPMGDVARGVETITTLAPYGFFFRRVHFAAGQACALLALAHALRHLAARRAARTPTGPRLRLAAALAVCFALLATGFILKGDAESRLAGTVLRGLAESVPLAGPALAPLVAGEGEAFFLPPYVLHCFILPLALLALMGRHVRRWLPGPGTLWTAAAVLGAWGLFVPMPPSPPPGLPALEASGPWFLYGLQLALRHAPPLAAGVLAPLLLAAALVALPCLRGTAGRAVRITFACAAVGYLALGLALA
ncbi:cytochrome b N-terminal domain-containing protein [Desulfocurvus sp. DL9XJH121]